MRIEYGNIASRLVECTDQERDKLRYLLATLEGENFFRPDGAFLSGLGFYFAAYGLDVQGLPPPDTFWDTAEIPADLLSGVTLREGQIRAIRQALRLRRGVIAQATGAGKSEEYAAICKMVGPPTVCVFDTCASASQMAKRLKERGLSGIGIVGGGRKQFSDHTMVVSDSAYARLARGDKRMIDLLGKARLIGFDEVHHLGTSATWQTICSYCPATYRIGLSATPFEPDPCAANLRLVGWVGPVIDYVTSKELRDRGELCEPIAFMIPVLGESVDPLIRDWTMLENKAIANHAYRNMLITSLCAHILRYEPQSKILVLVRLISHGRLICDELNKLGVRARFSSGGKHCYTEKQCTVPQSYEHTKEEFAKGEFSALIGTVVYDESADIPVVTDLVLAAGGKKLRRLKQRLGRGERLSKGKDHVRVWDFWDSQHPVTRHQSEMRLEGYSEESIQVISAPKLLKGIVSGTVHPDAAIGLLKGDGDETSEGDALSTRPLLSAWGV